MNLAGVQLTGEQVAAEPAAEAPYRSARAMSRRCWTWWPGPGRDRSCRAPSSSAGTSASGVTARWWQWRASGCARLAGPRSVRVCTDADFRGEGLATRLTLAVASAITDRGEMPFLHAAADNVNAIRLYESLGFRLRRTATFVVMRTPRAG